jgi:hypothetical protein
MSERSLTSGEITMLSTVYGNSIDYSEITLNTGTLQNGNATTVGNTISFSNFYSNGQPKNIPLPPDFSDTNETVKNKAWLVHEVAHIWQWQVDGVFTPFNAVGASISNGFDYSAAYDYSIHDNFDDMNIEQQASAIADRFLIANGEPPKHCTDCSPNLTAAGAAIDQLLKPFNNHNQGVGVSLLNFLMPPAYGADINPQTNDFFNAAQNWQPRRDPLTLDLDGDGLETTGFTAASPIYFDHDLNGIKEGTGWVKSDDGFLVLDRNGNGTIDNGLELFGDHTLLMSGDYAADGFAALAQEDTNQDGKVDATDARFAELRVWRDLNQNGLSEANELFTLNSLGIASINVASTDHSQMLANGNQIADLGSYTKTDGSTGITGEVSGNLADINLVANTFHREFTTHPDTSAVAHLPDMQGSGQVRDLREAASLSSPLAVTLSIFAAQTTRTGQLAQVDMLIADWATSSGMQTRDSDFSLRYR